MTGSAALRSRPRGRGVQLDDVLEDTVTVPADTLRSSEVDFTLPPPLADPSPLVSGIAPVG